MPSYQSGMNVSVRHKRQSALGTRATGASGFEIPLVGSGGIVPTKAGIPDPQIRSDGMNDVDRHGTRGGAGSYGAAGVPGAWDGLIEDLFRADATATFTLTQSDFTSITTGTATIVFASGSPISLGIKVGDVVYITGHATAGNNNILLPVIALSATTITVPASSLTADAVADTSVSIIVWKRFTMGTTNYYRTFEEYHADIDQSEVFDDGVVSSMQLEMQADQTVVATFGVVIRDWESMATGSSPVLTSPTTYGGEKLIATGATILKDGVAVSDLTGFSVTVERNAAGIGVIGATKSPDIWRGNARVSGSITLPRADLTYLDLFDDETTFSLFFLLKKPGSAPQDGYAVFVPVCKLMSAPDAALGGEGAMMSTVSFSAGKKPTTSGYAETMIQMSGKAS